jgi:TPP-dependent pyruvate/acetoin dehydrogenase alpha subunit
LFFETINAAGVLQVPMVMSVWDDEYGISVHKSTKQPKKIFQRFLKDIREKMGPMGMKY